MPDHLSLEQRTVAVELPNLSPDANHRLTEAVRAVIGTDSVRVPADRPRISQGDRARLSPLQKMTATKAMAVGMLAVGVCVALIIVLQGGNTWFLTGVAFVVLVIALALVVPAIIGLASTTEFPDPTLAALLSEQGVSDPDNLFTELVNEFTPPDNGVEHRTTAVEDDPAVAVAEQRESVTPSGGPSTAVGPGSDS